MDFGGPKSDIFVSICTERGGGGVTYSFFFFFGGLPSNSGHIDIDKVEANLDTSIEHNGLISSFFG